MKFRDLEKVRSIVMDATGLEISYAYDDLVFPDHSAFLIRFNDSDENKLYCHFHKDCIASEKTKIIANLKAASKQENCSLIPEKSFDMEQRGEEVQIKFLSN